MAAQAQRGSALLAPAVPSAAMRSTPVTTNSSSNSNSRFGSMLVRAAPAETKAIGKAQHVKVEDGPAIMDDIDCVIFDCDGGYSV